MLGILQGGYRSAHATTGALAPPEAPAPAGKLPPGEAKKAGKVVFGGGNRLLAAKVWRPSPPLRSGALVAYTESG